MLPSPLLLWPAAKRAWFGAKLRLLGWALVTTSSVNAAGGGIFRAGAATSNITPELGFVMRVGSFDQVTARHVRDELHARCLVLDDGSTRLAFIVCDALVLNREVVDEVKMLIRAQTGLPPEAIIMSATHSHTAPSIRSSDARKFTLPLTAYETFFAKRVVDGVKQAINQLEPARIAWGTVDLPDHVFNRRWFVSDPKLRRNPFGGIDQVRLNPPFASPALIKTAGPIDPGLSFVSVQAANGRPLAVLANYSLHYVGGIKLGDVSADYFGVFADRIQELLGADRQDPPFVGLLTNGTSGDINNNNPAQPRERLPNGAKMRLVANDMAQKIQRAIAALPHRDGARLKAAFVDLELNTRRPTPELITWAKQVQARGTARSPTHVNEDAYAQRTLYMADYPEHIRFPLHAFRIGELAVLSVPVEAFAEIGLTLKEKSPTPTTFTIGLANGYFGYLPTPRHHALGGYETWLGTNRMAPDTSTKMTDALLQLLADLRAQ
ncbi:MAG: hypothetical protein RIQ93_2441 [Verrucomicrobiota bacterium]